VCECLGAFRARHRRYVCTSDHKTLSFSCFFVCMTDSFLLLNVVLLLGDSFDFTIRYTHSLSLRLHHFLRGKSSKMMSLPNTIKIPFTSYTVDSLIDALLVQNNQEKLGNVLKPILHFVIVVHVLALVAWIVLLVRQKPPRVRDRVDLSKES